VGVPAGAHLGGWLAAGALSAAALPLAYATLVRFDPAILPIALGTMAIVEAVSRGMQRPFPGALTGALAAALVTALVAWWCFRALNRARADGSAELLTSLKTADA
jgi:hypothetical protein